jgi:hypothetical protein
MVNAASVQSLERNDPKANLIGMSAELGLSEAEKYRIHLALVI